VRETLLWLLPGSGSASLITCTVQENDIALKWHFVFFFTVFYSSSDASLAEILFLCNTQSNILAPFRWLWGSRIRTRDSCVLCLVSSSCLSQLSHHIPYGHHIPNFVFWSNVLHRLHRWPKKLTIYKDFRETLFWLQPGSSSATVIICKVQEKIVAPTIAAFYPFVIDTKINWVWAGAARSNIITEPEPYMKIARLPPENFIKVSLL
jgi:hypothetical protein